MIYLLGDVQGCCDALDRMLAKVDFSPSRDRLYVLGDLVNRGPRSLDVLRRLEGFGESAVSLLGNHDLHLLAVAHGVGGQHRGDTLDTILDSPERDRWIAWLRQQRMAVQAHGWLMVHAGVVPQWDAEKALALAAEVEAHLRSDELHDFLKVMYGNEPSQWREDLRGHDRLRFTINVLTRLRFCTADGRLDLMTKDGVGSAPEGYYPWFAVPGRKTAGVPIACGHWSTLGLVERTDLLAIDTGCVWGGHLTAVRIDGGRRDVIQVPCDEGRKPD